MANRSKSRGRGPAPTGTTPQVSMRLSPETLAQIDALISPPILRNRTDVVKHAIGKLFVDTGLAKSEKK